jgi:hypothetical protein
MTQPLCAILADSKYELGEVGLGVEYVKLLAE